MIELLKYIADGCLRVGLTGLIGFLVMVFLARFSDGWSLDPPGWAVACIGVSISMMAVGLVGLLLVVWLY